MELEGPNSGRQIPRVVPNNAQCLPLAEKRCDGPVEARQLLIYYRMYRR